jgi:CubicO group peptidase (beta-lactamase class C family)
VSRLAALALLVGAWVAPAAVSAQTRATWGDFTRRLDAYARADGIVGASAVFLSGGVITARHNYGSADAAANRPVTDSTIFHWGSVTKTLGAVAILQLRDRGRLTLDDPVLRWIPELRQVHDPFGAADSITIRMLLSHSAGYQSPTWPWGEGESWEPFEPTRWEQLVAMMPYQRLMFRPGTRYGYSNPAYVYLARIVEAASGDPWQSYVQKNILTPLGLTRSYFGATPYHLADARSHGYYTRRDSAGRDSVIDVGADFDPGITIPNGGWNAPVDDVAAWLAALAGRAASEVVQRRTLGEMWTPVVDVGPDPGSGAVERMGLGFFVVDVAGRRFVGHTGTQAGYRSWVRLDPETATGYVIVVNTSNQSRRGTAPELTAMLQAAHGLLQ